MIMPTVSQSRVFYGNPETIEVRLVIVKPPFDIYYCGQKVRGIRIHPKLSESLFEVFHDLHCQFPTQAEFDALHISTFSGGYSKRSIRGSNAISFHAYGAALDFDAEHNAMTYKRNAGFFKANHPLVLAFKKQGWFWGGDFKGRRDPMHFEAVRR